MNTSFRQRTPAPPLSQIQFRNPLGKRSKKAAPVPSAAQAAEPKARANARFYDAFLWGEIPLGNTIPAWMLPKLVADNRMGIAQKFLRRVSSESVEKKGRALEWALILLDAAERRILGLQGELPPKAPIPDADAAGHGGLGQQLEEVAKLNISVVSSLQSLSAVGHYEIKTPWIKVWAGSLRLK
ncbi:MAG: hypothetical protein WC263_02800 [Candidatus Micrarchaeia archaeon]|jgi:hypothetical protein